MLTLSRSEQLRVRHELLHIQHLPRLIEEVEAEIAHLSPQQPWCELAEWYDYSAPPSTTFALGELPFSTKRQSSFGGIWRCGSSTHDRVQSVARNEVAVFFNGSGGEK